MGGSARASRGQPVIVLALIVFGWAMARTALWTSPFGAAKADAFETVMPLPRPSWPDPSAVPLPRGNAPPAAAVVGGGDGGVPERAFGRVDALPRSVEFNKERQVGQDTPQRHAALAEDRSAMAPPKNAVRPGYQAKPYSRWSADAWALVRRGGGDAGLAAGQPAYGATQIGAVMRYRLDAEDSRGAYAFLRATLAPGTNARDRELAFGLGVRPLRSVPLRVLLETRMQDNDAGASRIRPVVTVVTELPPLPLPMGLRAEVYGQGGYAGGRGRTAFFDAQAVVDGALLPKRGGWTNGDEGLRIGAGAWAGGQAGAARFDIGPQVSLRIHPTQATTLRIALDWRERVAGRALPGSGPALSVASSF